MDVAIQGNVEKSSSIGKEGKFVIFMKKQREKQDQCHK